MSVLFTQLTPKLLELICEIVPRARIVGLLVNPSSPSFESVIRDAREAARAKGVQLAIVKASSESEIDAAFSTLIDLRADAVVVGADPFLGVDYEAAAWATCDSFCGLQGFSRVSPARVRGLTR